MFAKLKKKLEEGESGGPERLAFSPRKLPGGAVAIRSPPADGTPHGVDDSKPEAETRREEVKENEGNKKKEDVKSFSVESIDLVRKTKQCVLFTVGYCSNMYMYM